MTKKNNIQTSPTSPPVDKEIINGANQSKSPGETTEIIKTKPSVYCTVVNSTLDNVIFISKREIMDKKWKVNLPNLTPEDIKLLQLSTNIKRQVKPVTSNDIITGIYR